MKNEIIYPEQTTYYICYNDNKEKVMAYGRVDPNLQMQTGQPIMESYTDYQEWVDAMLGNGINPLDEVEETNFE
jgi:hypothetical protein